MAESGTPLSLPMLFGCPSSPYLAPDNSALPRGDPISTPRRGMLDYFLGRMIPAVVRRCAPVAQSAEQGTLNPKVVGSIPTGRTNPGQFFSRAFTGSLKTAFFQPCSNPDVAIFLATFNRNRFIGVVVDNATFLFIFSARQLNKPLRFFLV